MPQRGSGVSYHRGSLNRNHHHGWFFPHPGKDGYKQPPLNNILNSKAVVRKTYPSWGCFTKPDAPTSRRLSTLTYKLAPVVCHNCNSVLQPPPNLTKQLPHCCSHHQTGPYLAKQRQMMSANLL